MGVEERAGDAALAGVQHAQSERFERRCDTRSKLSVVVKQEDGRGHFLDSVAPFGAPTKESRERAQEACR